MWYTGAVARFLYKSDVIRTISEHIFDTPNRRPQQYIGQESNKRYRANPSSLRYLPSFDVLLPSIYRCFTVVTTATSVWSKSLWGSPSLVLRQVCVELRAPICPRRFEGAAISSLLTFDGRLWWEPSLETPFNNHPVLRPEVVLVSQSWISRPSLTAVLCIPDGTQLPLLSGIKYVVEHL